MSRLYGPALGYLAAATLGAVLALLIAAWLRGPAPGPVAGPTADEAARLHAAGFRAPSGPPRQVLEAPGQGPRRLARRVVGQVSPGPASALPPQGVASPLCALATADLAGGCLEETVLVGGRPLTRLTWTGRLRLPPEAACVDEGGAPRLELRRTEVLRELLVEEAEAPPVPAYVTGGLRRHLALAAGVSSAPALVVGGTYYGAGRRLGGAVLYERGLDGASSRLLVLASYRLTQ